MARNRTPTTILEASGALDHNPDRRVARENEPLPTEPLGDPPKFLTKAQRAIWLEVELYAPKGVLTISDRMLTEHLCILKARERGGAVLKAAESADITTILSLMGLTPADRSRLNVPTEQKQQAAGTFNRLATTGRGNGATN